jgi:hypothetical protein
MRDGLVDRGGCGKHERSCKVVLWSRFADRSSFTRPTLIGQKSCGTRKRNANESHRLVVPCLNRRESVSSILSHPPSVFNDGPTRLRKDWTATISYMIGNQELFKASCACFCRIVGIRRYIRAPTKKPTKNPTKAPLRRQQPTCRSSAIIVSASP